MNPYEALRYLEEGRLGVEGELDPVGQQLLLRTESCSQGGGQGHRPEAWTGRVESAEGMELETQSITSHWMGGALLYSPLPGLGLLNGCL